VALSRTQVDRLGDRLRKEAVPSDDDLRLLSEFREDRRAVMDAVGSALTEIVGSVPARRLKTINSIVDKLRREKSRLSTVQDIAGLRIVRDMTRTDQDQIVGRILVRFPDSKVSIAAPPRATATGLCTWSCRWAGTSPRSRYVQSFSTAGRCWSSASPGTGGSRSSTGSRLMTRRPRPTTG
jgi:Region found in RelA / SpoT proteins